MKIGCVGCGQVGATSAYACAMRGLGTEIVLVDLNRAFADAQAEDILHGTPFAEAVPVRGGAYGDLEGAGIVMISAGVAQKPGESRLDLLKRNAAVFEAVIPNILRYAPDAVLLIASNPVDVMTHVAAAIARQEGHDPAKIIGSGTILDTARFRALIGAHLDVSSHSVHAYVFGEHGDSEVLQWSGVSIGNMPLGTFAAQVGAPVTQDVRARIDDQVRHAAARIIAGKGATWFGIGAGMARICEAIMYDQHAVLTCCAPLAEVEGIRDVTLSVPHIISSAGIETAIYPDLSEDEAAAMHESAHILRSAIEETGYV